MMVDVHSHFFRYPEHFSKDFAEQAKRARNPSGILDLQGNVLSRANAKIQRSVSPVCRMSVGRLSPTSGGGFIILFPKYQPLNSKPPSISFGFTLPFSSALFRACHNTRLDTRWSCVPAIVTPP